jgi:predicted ABC-type ATPase
VIHFVNADLIASGLFPLRPDLAVRRAGRLVLAELFRLSKERKHFAFESTLSGRTYLRLLSRWKKKGYQIEIVFLRLATVDIAFQRVAARVRQGGHDVPRRDVIRRFDRSGTIFSRYIVPSPMSGRSMIIQAMLRGYWRLAHESRETQGRNEAICGGD